MYLVPGALERRSRPAAWRGSTTYPGQARIVPSIPQLIEDLRLLDDTPGLGHGPSLEAELIELGKTARAVALELVGGRGTVDELVAATGHAVATVLGALTLLEMRGLGDQRIRPISTRGAARGSGHR